MSNFIINYKSLSCSNYPTVLEDNSSSFIISQHSFPVRVVVSGNVPCKNPGRRPLVPVCR